MICYGFYFFEFFSFGFWYECYGDRFYSFNSLVFWICDCVSGCDICCGFLGFFEVIVLKDFEVYGGKVVILDKYCLYFDGFYVLMVLCGVGLFWW